MSRVSWRAVERQLQPHVDAMAALARAHEPDWSRVDWDVDLHNWCGETCVAVGNYLAEHGFVVRSQRGEIRGWTHCWLVLPDGSILDPTISQFDRQGTEYTIDTDSEVSWLVSPRGARIAVILTDDLLYGDYRAYRRST